MELEDVYRRDLNLLVALKVLLDEGSVSRAAIRLNLSQSAMSRVLGRLRDLVGDPLFTRQGQSLLPTQRALELNEQLNEPLESLRLLLTPNDFDPATCEQTFKIATTDYAMQTILPFALPRIYQEAPHIALEFSPLRHDNVLSQLTTGGCDMAICRPSFGIEPLCHQLLGLVSVFCLVSPDHPLANKPLTLQDYLTYPHAMIAISDGVKALIDEQLRGYSPPKMVLRAYHLEAALAIIEQMPLIITVPADLAYLVAERYQLIVKPLPFEFKPFDYSLLWHARCEHSASQIWLRTIIKQECGRLIDSRIHDIGLL
ncbi:LysR family transcriptional regulator [Photobacterium carnosum]|uniref:LysR family transcriptional regulator n=1 Tax=Photobacterium carnosum TaxID=2023717 RepID=A0A2N4UPE8_9GAMM|nr:LysR family transcriptional regulator [Photobacterium carnosum]KAE8176106.1 LysR family transcriptional regulator [Photobacterium carnosum]MCD9496041.1 LysR family transcriptional regulator [Photobacterium carnosum]MCD9499964.1 LysR family transcriptional regulator [Photobacterium carnosum]MCD9515927.1 LysR family transcriptional regulator [Photobacterium carnosum]MCD9523911.1 LysR family transcriptional regulator [Photobacterium carnosum]